MGVYALAQMRQLYVALQQLGRCIATWPVGPRWCRQGESGGAGDRGDQTI
jgi:hypothetical protein